MHREKSRLINSAGDVPFMTLSLRRLHLKYVKFMFLTCITLNNLTLKLFKYHFCVVCMTMQIYIFKQTVYGCFPAENDYIYHLLELLWHLRERGEES